jgi:hypothetical protein
LPMFCLHLPRPLLGWSDRWFEHDVEVISFVLLLSMEYYGVGFAGAW